MKSEKLATFENEVQKLLLSMGYSKSKWYGGLHLFSKKINTNIYEVLLFSYTNYMIPGCSSVDCKAGVCFDEIERVKYELFEICSMKQMRASRYVQNPTIRHDVDYHMPLEERYNSFRWSIYTAEDAPFVANGIVKEFDKYGHYLSDRYRTWESLLKGLEDTNNKDFDIFDRKYNLPVMYYLLGDKKRGLEYITSLQKDNPKCYSDFPGPVFIKNYDLL